VIKKEGRGNDMNYEEYDENITSFWDRLRFYIFIKLAQSFWQYMIIHTDYWKRPYGMTFTGNRDFYKKLKYDLKDMDDDLEVEAKKQG